MRFTFTVEVEVERDEGKFASRDEIADQIRDALESADPGTYEGENGGAYSTVDWMVDEAEPVKAPKKPKGRVLNDAEAALLDGLMAQQNAAIEEAANKREEPT